MTIYLKMTAAQAMGDDKARAGVWIKASCHATQASNSVADIHTTMSSPSSLRELYAPPTTSWSFDSSSEPAPVPVGSVPSSSASYQWATRPSQNSVLDLSPSLGETGANGAQIARAIAASALMQYTTTAMIMPFEVGKTLLQVQWVPRDAEDLPEADVEEEDRIEEVR